MKGEVGLFLCELCHLRLAMTSPEPSLLSYSGADSMNDSLYFTFCWNSTLESCVLTSVAIQFSFVCDKRVSHTEKSIIFWDVTPCSLIEVTP